MATPRASFREELERQAPQFAIELLPHHLEKLSDYYELLLKWNPALHLVAPCSPAEFAIRHILESLVALKYLPLNAKVVDVGSGGGLPIVACLAVRVDLQATLIESSQRKVVFLREALRAIEAMDRTDLIAARFQDVPPPQAHFVTCRALDRFSLRLPELIKWAMPNSTFLIFAGPSLMEQSQSLLASSMVERIPLSDRRFIVAGRKPA